MTMCRPPLVLFMLITALAWNLTPTLGETGPPPIITRPPKNDSVRVGEKYLMSCEIQSEGQFSVVWEHYYAKVPRHGDSRRYTRRGGLRFTRITLNDRGQYRCKVQNSTGSVFVASNYAFLNVQAPAAIIDGPTNRTVSAGVEVHLACETMGLPTPTVSWTRNGKPIIDPETERIYARSKLIFNSTENATYECTAENRLSDTRTPIVVKKKAFITIREDSSSRGVCAYYNGSVCRAYLGSQVVWYNSSLAQPAHDTERMVAGLWPQLIERLESNCRAAAERILCHSAFPQCNRTANSAKPMLTCREDCLAVKDLYCHEDWSHLVSSLPADHVLSSLTQCQKLPSRYNTSRPCTSSQLFHIRPSHFTTTCYEGKGELYRGRVSKTRSGIVCQAWAAQSPHRHPHLPAASLVLQDAHNYCRNPGGSMFEQPWCYTTDMYTKWDYCNVQPCDDTANSTDKAIDESSRSSVMDFFTMETIVIMSAVGTVALILAVLIIVLCCRMSDQKKRIRYNAAPQYDTDIDVERLTSNLCYFEKPPIANENPKLEKLEFPRNEIVYLRDIGQGAFGRVFCAKVPDIVHGSEWTMVAVKMLKEEATEETQRDFEREASLMVELVHPNILRLLGVCAIGKPMCLLFEFMSKGDLNEFLRNCSPEHFIVRNRSTEVLTEDVPKLNHVEELEIAKQIASGMVYLYDKGYVHRDLATRNCLVGDNLTVKISDFGLARSVHRGEFYEGSEHDAIPIRWMPLEAIVYNKFTSESDVWSFGVVLWEIFAFALQPYYDMSAQEVVRYLRDGKMLSCPDNTPQDVYDLMRLCWARRPQNRPPFNILLKSICQLQEEFKKKKRTEMV